jgi:type I restriction enzyme S subunit
MEMLSQRSSGQTGVDLPELKKYSLGLPPLPEQKAIAQTLSDVDALIAALDKLIAKKRNIKTATMQQLLTGKTRLPGFGEGKGYKKTEVGVIPEDWKICILSELSQIVTGQTPPTHNRSYYGDEYLFVSPADIGSQKYITNTFAKLSKLGFSISRKYPSKTILFTCIGSTIGKCAIVVTESTSNQQINAILPSNLVNHQYLYYQLINNAKKIKNRAATQAVPIINKTEFGSTFIVVCSDEEQKAIAQVLCDIDTEITALEKRRAKTQAIKQGMMQELLTGKTRLINN